MANKDTDKLRKVIEDTDLSSDDANDLVEYLLSLTKRGELSPLNFVFRRAEHFHNRFLINKVIGFGHTKHPLISYEISDVGSEKSHLPYLSHIENLRASSLENEISSELKALSEKVKLLSNQLDETQKHFLQLQSESEQLKDYIFNQVCKQITNATSQEIQSIPISIFLDTNDSKKIFNAYTSVLDFLSSIDFMQTVDLKPIKGSWFKKLIANSKSAITSKEVTDRLKEAEYGVEVNTILKPQSEVDKNNSEALVNILKSIETIPNAAIRIGSLIVVKVTSVTGEANIQVRTLSIKELHLLNKKPELLSRPSEVLVALAKEITDDNKNPSLEN